jgi:transposase
LTTEQRWSCVALHKDGRSQRYIARHLGVTRDTVRATLARYATTGSPGSGSRSGRPRCTDLATDAAIVERAQRDKFTSPRRLRAALEVAASRRTLDRRLQEAGLFGRVARHKRDYSDEERRRRLSFANGYQHWTADQWEQVLFSDEKTFYGRGFCGRVWVRRPVGAALDPEYTVHKQCRAEIKVGAWACFCAKGVGYMKMYEQNMDGPLMKSVLSTELLPSARMHYQVDDAEPWHLLHDNDKKFKSIVVTAWLHNAGISVLDFPPYSPDLNPIENLWHIVQVKVDEHDCETPKQLEDAVRAEWSALSPDLCRTLARSMPDRLRAVIEANGWHTKC